MNTVPIGTEMVIKKTNQKVKLVVIQHFPTMFKCDDGNVYATYEVNIEDMNNFKSSKWSI